MSDKTVRLLISCPDARGIIAAVTNFIAQHEGNILDADQHSDPANGEFFMRIEIDQNGFGLRRAAFTQAWQPVADRFRMRWRVHWGEDVKRMAILVSREDHCLNDLLWRWRIGELSIERPLVISNHGDVRQQAEALGVPFACVANDSSSKREAETTMLRQLRESKTDFVVLARYMQILSPAFVAQFPDLIINIHHSFLPAFAGRRPYHQAFERGVKIIGATSHYVTNQLDDGPIIAQATIPINHRDNIDDLIRKGRDLERMVLAQAVRWHVEDRILVSKNKTIVFE